MGMLALLALKTQKGNNDSRNTGDLKRLEKAVSLLEPPERNTTMSTP